MIVSLVTAGSTPSSCAVAIFCGRMVEVRYTSPRATSEVTTSYLTGAGNFSSVHQPSRLLHWKFPIDSESITGSGLPLLDSKERIVT